MCEVLDDDPSWVLHVGSFDRCLVTLFFQDWPDEFIFCTRVSLKDTPDQVEPINNLTWKMCRVVNVECVFFRSVDLLHIFTTGSTTQATHAGTAMNN